MDVIMLLAVVVIMLGLNARVVDILQRVHRRQIDYMILGGKSTSDMDRSSRKSIGHLVREMQKRGYEPVGCPVIDDNGYWYQAVVKYERYFKEKDND